MEGSLPDHFGSWRGGLNAGPLAAPLDPGAVERARMTTGRSRRKRRMNTLSFS
jgi:hypothetical protein